MSIQIEGVPRRTTEAAVVLVTALVVTSMLAMPAIAGELADEGASPTRMGVDSTESEQRESGVLDQRLQTRLANSSPNETVRALVVLEEQPNVSAVRERSNSREELVRELKGDVRASQAPLLQTIERLQSSGDVATFERHWLVNAVSVEATPAAIRELGKTDDVAAVLADSELGVSTGPMRGQDSANTTEQQAGSNVTVTEVDGIERSTTAPRAFDARAEVALPEALAVSDRVGDFDVEGASEPEPITGPPSDDIPAAASTPFDGDGVAWGVERIRADAATRAGYDGSNVTVAVIDTGIDDSHPDLDDRVVGWTDFVNGFENPYDDGGHGTHVAGTIAGTGDSGIRTGVAPGADLLGVKVLDGDGSGLLSDVLAGMEWSIRNGADVMSLSLGGPHDPVFHYAADRAAAAGVVPVVAAGNIGGSRDPFTVDLQNLLAVTDPGHARSAVTVGATHWQDRIAWFSARETFAENNGTYVKPDVAAPGANVTSAEAGTEGYVNFSGTSMATPHVSGLAALVMQADPTADPDEVRQLIGRTAIDLGESGADGTYGAGRVDASAVLAAADEENDVALDVTTNETENGTTVTAVATVTDESGAPLAGENVSLNVIYGPPSTLETHKANAELYAYSGTQSTDENGTTTFRFAPPDDRKSPAGTYTVEATARGGLVGNTSTIDLGDEVTVTATSRNDSVRHNGDTLVFDIEARDAAGEPVNATIDAFLQGPTNDRLPNWNRTVRTGDDGNATVSVRIHDDLLTIYGGAGTLDGGPSFGRYDLVTAVRGDDGRTRDFAVHDGLVDVEPRWTDLEFAGSETPLTSVADVETWQGDVTISERVNASLDTTQSSASYRIVLADFSPEPNETEGPNVGTKVPLETVTTDETGSATFETRIPASTPGGYYAVLAVPEGRNVTDPGPVGSYDVGYVYVRALETDIRIESREDADNQAFQPDESVRVTVTTRNASTGEPADPRDLTLQTAGLKNFSSIQQTAPGTVEMNGRMTVRGSSDGVVRAVGTDQNGGTFANHTERVVARPFTLQVLPDAPSYEPGANATLDVHVADSESGDAVAGAEVNAVVTGLASSESWRVNRTVRTDRNGSATITVPIPPDAVGIDFIASDALVLLTSVEKGNDVARATTGFDLDERDEPSISVSQNGSEQVGLFGLNDVAIYEPGDRITFDIEATGVDPELVEERDRHADVIAVKYSKVGDGTYVFDANESETAVVSLDDRGSATYEYRLSDDADPGLVVPIVSTRINGVALSDSQLGIVGASPVNVSTNRSSVAPGESITFSASGDIPSRADVDFVVKRKGSQGQVPVAAVDDGSPPDLAPMLSERNRTLARTDSLARDVVDRLPERIGNRDSVHRALRDVLVPAMSQPIASSATGGAIEVDPGGTARSGADGSDVEKSFNVPENLAPGTYRVVVIVSADDHGSVKERIGFAEFEVEE